MTSFEIRKKMYINENAQINGKVVIITGCNTGIGKAAAHELAKRGGKIYFACRDEERAMKALNEIKNSTKNENLFFLKLDLGSLQSVRDFSMRFHELESRLDILINNAGVFSPLNRTSDGFEMNFGVNHLGHFLLTNLLLDMIKSAAPSRIIVVSSSSHAFGRINKDDINSEKSFGGSFYGYGTSKLCNILFMRELSKRLEGSGVVCNALCPGPVYTEAMRYLNPVLRFILNTGKKWFHNTPEVGCQAIVMLAVEPSIANETGYYYDQFTKKEPSLRGQNYELWLWEKSEELIRLNEQQQETSKA